MSTRENASEWPVVDRNDDGIRPAGKPDECFYCGRKVGQPHGQQCAVVTKRVKVRYSFDIEIEVPHFWDKGLVEFARNEGTWCADNAFGDIEAFAKDMGCTCSIFQCGYLGDADDTPTRKIRRHGEEAGDE